MIILLFTTTAIVAQTDSKDIDGDDNDDESRESIVGPMKGLVVQDTTMGVKSFVTNERETSGQGASTKSNDL